MLLGSRYLFFEVRGNRRDILLMAPSLEGWCKALSGNSALLLSPCLDVLMMRAHWKHDKSNLEQPFAFAAFIPRELRTVIRNLRVVLNKSCCMCYLLPYHVRLPQLLKGAHMQTRKPRSLPGSNPRNSPELVPGRWSRQTVHKLS